MLGYPGHLNVSGNIISSMSTNFIQKQRVRYILIYDYNRLTDIELPMNSEELYCSYNLLTSLPKMSTCPVTLNKQPCNITCNLHVVFAEWNRITHVEAGAFSPCHLSILSLEGNPIHVLPIKYFINLASLSLSHTSLGNISSWSAMNGNSSLRNLSLSNIPMFRQNPETLSFYLPALQYMLFLCDNGIVNIPNMTAPLLESVFLGKNNIGFVSQDLFLGIPRIRHVDLDSNRIKSISAQSFTFCIFIKELNLENNQIQHISQSAFINQGHFILRLGNNHLVSILPSSLPLLSRTVYLDPNPWHCDCESTALRRWLLLSGVQLYQCMKPSNFRNRSLVSLRESELCPGELGDFEPSGGHSNQRNKQCF